MNSKPVFFDNVAGFRQWLEENHSTCRELQVGFFKVGSGKATMTWSESVDEALCFGWIDGLRKSIDENAYTIRFTPRKSNSAWSAINIRKVELLRRAGRMHPAGLAAFQGTLYDKKRTYSYEKSEQELPDEYLSIFRKDSEGLKNFLAMAPSYQRTAIHWVLSAKQEATRSRRLNQLIADSRQNLKVKPFRYAAN